MNSAPNLQQPINPEDRLLKILASIGQKDGYRGYSCGAPANIGTAIEMFFDEDADNFALLFAKKTDHVYASALVGVGAALAVDAYVALRTKSEQAARRQIKRKLRRALSRERAASGNAQLSAGNTRRK